MEMLLLKQEKDALLERLKISESKNLYNKNLLENELHVNQAKNKVYKIKESNCQKTSEKICYSEVLSFENDFKYEDFVLINSVSNLVNILKHKMEALVLSKFKTRIKLMYYNLRVYGICFHFKCYKYFSCKSIKRKIFGCKKVFQIKYIKLSNLIVIMESSQIFCQFKQ
jgi:hypothetical protein